MRAEVAPLWPWVGPTNLGRRPMDLRPGLPRRPKFASLLSRCSFHAPWCAGLGVKTLAIGQESVATLRHMQSWCGGLAVSPEG